MLTKFLILLLLLSLSSCFHSKTLTEQEQEVMNQKASDLMFEFLQTLKPKISKVFVKGAEHAVQIFGAEYRQTIKKIEANNPGWKIRFISNKPINIKNLSNDWETKALKKFKELESEYELPIEMSFSQVIDGKYKYIIPQENAKGCIACHSTVITPILSKAIQRRYPNLSLEGFGSPYGGIIGAISASKEL